MSAIASGAAAQFADNRNARSVFASDVTDARSIWVNPGALGLAGTLSIFADLTIGMEPPYESGSPVQQWSFGLNSYFVAFSYQFDRMPDTLGGMVKGSAVRLAIWGRHEKVGGGGAVTWYTGGDDGGVGVDAGMVYRAGPLLDLGAAIANIGQPTVRGIHVLALLRPAVTLHTQDGAFTLQAQSEIDTRGLRGFALGTAINVSLLHLTARLDANDELERTSFTFGLSFGRETHVGALVTGYGDLSTLDATSVHLTSERSNQPNPRRR